jgi:predicted AlkP superfamily pyrophosphatase or phosphodiesterase
MSGKIILIVCDALRDDVAAQHMGYLEHLVEAKKATRWTVVGELPSMSRPMYETLHTGVPSSVHGIVNNAVVRLSVMPNVFGLAREHGKTTAAAAYQWYSELYNRAPFDPVRDVETDDESLPIQHGRFYMSDDYPDLDLFTKGGVLLAKFLPDYLLIHPMGLDTIGEREGGDSHAYRKQVIYHDGVISFMLPSALALGYHVIVTADHGISGQAARGQGGVHGGNFDEARLVPLYWITPDQSGRGRMTERVSQLAVAPTVLSVLGIPIPETMARPPLTM